MIVYYFIIMIIIFYVVVHIMKISSININNYVCVCVCEWKKVVFNANHTFFMAFLIGCSFQDVDESRNEHFFSIFYFILYLFYLIMSRS